MQTDNKKILSIMNSKLMLLNKCKHCLAIYNISKLNLLISLSRVRIQLISNNFITQSMSSNLFKIHQINKTKKDTI